MSLLKGFQRFNIIGIKIGATGLCAILIVLAIKVKGLYPTRVSFTLPELKK